MISSRYHRRERSTSSPQRRYQGFTLVELMVVVIILAILAATIIPQFTTTTHDAKVSSAMANIAQLQNALERFKLRMDRYPTTEEGLEALVVPPKDAGTKWRPTIQRLIPDPWGNPYVYRNPGMHGVGRYDLWSRGADGKDGGEETGADITNWNDEETTS